jgi:sugar transferase EpsL
MTPARVRGTLYQSYGKRILDLLAALLVLALIWPLLGGIYLLLFFSIGNPVLFRQRRPGLMGRPFTMVKFRTMSNQQDVYGRLLPDERRITRFGQTIRSCSLDELPEIFNVLKGEMSFVGPRPLLMRYLPRYTSEQARRHEVLPGITGWAQVNGRNALSWDEKFALDVWYVDHQSFALDLRILALTIWRVLRRDGISAEGFITSPEFNGTSASGTKPHVLHDDMNHLG